MKALDSIWEISAYYYQVGGDVAGWSTEHGFNTLLSKGVSSTFAFVAFGDQGADDTGGSRRPLAVSASVEQDNPDLILMAGDIFYCDDQACVDTYFDDIMGNNLSSSYFMTAPGNHEFYQPDDLVTYTSRLAFPGRSPNQFARLSETGATATSSRSCGTRSTLATYTSSL